jgi:SAM-dependent MidA family methyltransferase
MAAPEGLTPLDELIRARIAREGAISVYEYMALCLGHPEHGYYRRREAIGGLGDFITAPEISQVFGELIGLWCAVIGNAIAPSEPLRLIELGPGRGTLMADALRALKTVTGLADRLCVHLVEPSPALAAIQRNMLATAQASPSWAASLADVPAGPAILIANEVIDALPVRQLVRTGGAWHERLIGLMPDDRLAFLVAERPAEGTPALPAADGSVLEVRPDAEHLFAEIGQRASVHPTVALLIDYGHERTATGDSLQAVRRHQAADPLSGAGQADLTAQVDFEALALLARRYGLDVDGPIPQAVFLGELGIVERAGRLMGSASADQALSIESGVLRLIDPGGMGSRFKVLALRSAGVGRLPGFSSATTPARSTRSTH